MTNHTSTHTSLIAAIVTAISWCVLPPTSNAAVIADIGGDWVSAAVEPAGWDYLESTLVTGGVEVPLTPSVSIGNAGATGFGGGASGFQLSAVLGDNANGGDYEIFLDGDTNHGGVDGMDLLVHPSGAGLVPAGEPFVIARYTLGASGDATITGGFQSVLGVGVDVFLLHNTTTLFSASGPLDRGLDGAFNENLTVSAGDTISFVVGSGTDIFGDETSIRATIDLVSTVPEPGTYACFGLLTLCLLGYGKVRKRYQTTL